jgi:hypothetical protein
LGDDEAPDATALERETGVMVYSIGLILYIVFCVLVGLCGSQRRMGFIGTFIISLLLTPVVVLIVLQLTGPSQRSVWHHRPQGD